MLIKNCIYLNPLNYGNIFPIFYRIRTRCETASLKQLSSSCNRLIDYRAVLIFEKIYMVPQSKWVNCRIHFLLYFRVFLSVFSGREYFSKRWQDHCRYVSSKWATKWRCSCKDNQVNFSWNFGKMDTGCNRYSISLMITRRLCLNTALLVLG